MVKMGIRRNRDGRGIGGFGRLVVGDGCVWGVILLFMVGSDAALKSLEEGLMEAEIKLVIAAVYSNFRTFVVDDEGIEQEDGYTCGPRGNKLFLRLEKVEKKQ